MKNVGPLFKEILKIKGVENKTLAENIGISPQQMGKLLTQGADNWKLSYFDKACSFLHIHPKSFFDNWGEGGNVIKGNVENNPIFGTTNFSMIIENDQQPTIEELQIKITEKENLIASMKEIIKLQRALLKNSGVDLDSGSIDAL